MPRDAVIDTHHHLWRIDRGDYFWMSPDLGVLYRDYGPDDLAPHLTAAGVTKTILVQAADTEAETDFLLDLAARTDWIAGVCGWLDLDDEAFPERLAGRMENPWFKSLRPMLQELTPDDWILKPGVLKNLAHMAETGARFEVLTKPPQLPHAVEALRRTPGLKAVVNHLSKPDIARRMWEPWAGAMDELATMPNVFCKISGMVTEAGPDWTTDDLTPYAVHALEAFGSDRCMFGSDWPVALLAAESYGEVLDTAQTVLAPYLDANGRQKVFHDTGAAFYGI